MVCREIIASSKGIDTLERHDDAFTSLFHICVVLMIVWPPEPFLMLSAPVFASPPSLSTAPRLPRLPVHIDILAGVRRWKAFTWKAANVWHHHHWAPCSSITLIFSPLSTSFSFNHNSWLLNMAFKLIWVIMGLYRFFLFASFPVLLCSFFEECIYCTLKHAF